MVGTDLVDPVPYVVEVVELRRVHDDGDAPGGGHAETLPIT
jgi:hypothetical protein